MTRVSKNLMDPAEKSLQVVIWGLAAIIVLIPLIIAPQVLGGGKPDLFNIPRLTVMRLLTVVVLGAWAWWLIREGEFWRFRSALFWPVLAFLLSFLLSTIFSVNSYLSFWGSYLREEGLYTIGNFILLFFITATSITTKERLNLLLNAILVGGVIMVSYGLMQKLGWDPIPWNSKDRIFGTTGNPDFFGQYLAMILPLIVVKFLVVQRLELKIYMFLFGLAAFAALLFTQTRGAWFGSIVSFLVLTILLVFEFRGRAKGIWQKNKVWILSVLVFALIGAVVLFAFTETGRSIVSRAFDALSSTGTGASRVLIWSRTLNVFTQHPLLGAGPENFRNVYMGFKPLAYASIEQLSNPDRAHNEYLDVLALRGILGGLAYLWLILAFILLLRRLTFRMKDNELRLLLTGLACGIIAYLAQNLFAFGVIPTILYFWLFLAILAGSEFVPIPTKESANKDSKMQPAAVESMRAFGSLKILRPIVRIPTMALAVVIMLFFSVFGLRDYIADTIYGTGDYAAEIAQYWENQAVNTQEPEEQQKMQQEASFQWQRAAESYLQSVQWHPGEAVYRAGGSYPQHVGGLAVALSRLATRGSAIDQKLAFWNSAREQFMIGLQNSLERENIYQFMAASYRDCSLFLDQLQQSGRKQEAADLLKKVAGDLDRQKTTLEKAATYVPVMSSFVSSLYQDSTQVTTSDTYLRKLLIAYAADYFELATRQDHTFYSAFNNLAIVYGELARWETDTIMQRNFYQKGVAAAEASTLINPSEWSSWINLCKLHMNRFQTLDANDPSAARQDLARAKEAAQAASKLNLSNQEIPQLLYQIDLWEHQLSLTPSVPSP